MLKNRLKDIRHDKRMNQTEFAAYLSITQHQYNRYENNKQAPTLEGALLISQRLSMPVEHIFYLDSNINASEA
ncbi:helix-turn-helix domain-containing protein [Paenibacillus qinlingensis]|uniref:Transcriptional regulator n=1 Tax=Paenibacillus qinlingensis TaxID=1837343 RepID=A0ABU1P764_9BACL|nr:helix-turn-helix domain-containing protein [Paenibacillus qinlingensis]MDR6555419.1 putative transcriptional regulator [Paenibacillus qinlingensis]